MAGALAKAIEDRQQLPEDVLEVEFDDSVLALDRATCERARAKARDARRPHNLARRVFVDELFEVLADQATGRFEVDLFDGVPEIPLGQGETADAPVLDAADRAEIRAELAASETVLAALDSLWPKATPQRLLRELLADPARLISAGLTGDDAETLTRPAKSPWTPADVPLLDELAELLGEDDTDQRVRRERREREERAYAEGVLHILEQDDEIIDEEVLRVTDILDAELFAERQQGRGELTAAERAARDRGWTFGHVIIDEAQELSPMG